MDRTTTAGVLSPIGPNSTGEFLVPQSYFAGLGTTAPTGTLDRTAWAFYPMSRLNLCEGNSFEGAEGLIYIYDTNQLPAPIGANFFRDNNVSNNRVVRFASPLNTVTGHHTQRRSRPPMRRSPATS